MKFSGFVNIVYDIGNWLARIMYLHLLWFVFTIVGLGIFGIMPATAALVYVIHKKFQGDMYQPIFKNFVTVYKAQFIKSNGLGLLLAVVGIFLFQDLKISRDVIQSFYVHAFLMFICFLFIITSLYFFTIYARYELKFFNYYKQSFLMAIARPFETIAMFISLGLVYYLFSIFPVLLLFMGSSISIYPLVWFGYRACVHVEEKKVMLTNKKESQQSA